MRPETDAMGNFDNWAVRVGLFGASSSASFMQHVSNIVDGTKTPDPDFKARGAASGHASTRPFHKIPAKSGNLHSREFVLPPRRTANLLLEIHWNCSQIIFPWVDRIRFMKQYEALWSDHEDVAPFLDEQVFYCILNIIFALSYKIDPNTDQGEVVRCPFFKSSEPFVLQSAGNQSYWDGAGITSSGTIFTNHEHASTVFPMCQSGDLDSSGHWFERAGDDITISKPT